MALSAPIGTLQYPYVRSIFSILNNKHITTDISSQYTFEQPYLTPYPSSTVESQQWSQYARASIPDVNNMTTYPMAQPLNFFHAPVQNAPNRPRSSPSTFGPSPDNLDWTPSAGLGIQYSTAVTGQPTPLTSTFPPLAFQTYGASEEAYESSSPPQLQQPQPRRPYQYQPIAPNPAGITASKRSREDEEAAASFGADSRPTSGNKRRRTTSSATTAAAAAVNVPPQRISRHSPLTGNPIVQRSFASVSLSVCVDYHTTTRTLHYYFSLFPLCSFYHHYHHYFSPKTSTAGHGPPPKEGFCHNRHAWQAGWRSQYGFYKSTENAAA